MRLRGAFIRIIFNTYIYKGFFVLPYMGRVIPLYIVGSYKPDDLFSFFQCGTNPHYSYLSGDVAQGGASDRVIDRAVGVDHVDADHRSRSEHVGFKFIITVRLPATWRHQTRRSRGARTTDHDQAHV